MFKKLFGTKERDTHAPYSKITFLGAEGCSGCTCLFDRLRGDPVFNSGGEPTVGAEPLCITSDKYKHRLGLQDTAGQEDYRRLDSIYTSGSNALVVVISVRREERYIELISQAKHRLSENPALPQLIPKILVLSMCDTRTKSEHSSLLADFVTFALEDKFQVIIETSAKENINIDKLVDIMFQLVISEKNFMNKKNVHIFKYDGSVETIPPSITSRLATRGVQQLFNPFNPPEITAASPRLSRKNSEINLTQLRDELTLLKQQFRQGDALIQVQQQLPALIQTLSEQHLQDTLSFLAQNQAGTQHAVALGQADLERQTALRQIESSPPLQDYYASFQWYIFQSFHACTVISSEKVEGQYEEDWTDKCLGFASDHSDIVPIPGVKLVVNALISAGQHVKQARKLNAVKRIAQLKMWATPLAIEPLFEAIARKLVLHPHKQHFIKMECSKITSPREGIVGFFIKAKGKIQGYYDDITQALDQSTAAQLAQKDVEALLAHMIETQQVELPRSDALVEHFVKVILDALKKPLALSTQAPASSSPLVSKRLPPPVPQRPTLHPSSASAALAPQKPTLPSGSVSAPPVLQTAPAPTMEQFLAIQKQMEAMMKAQQEAQFKAEQAAATIAKLQKQLGDSDTTVSGGSQAQMQISRSANASGQGMNALPQVAQQQFVEHHQRLRELEQIVAAGHSSVLRPRTEAEEEARRKLFE